MGLILYLERMLWGGPLLVGLLGTHVYFTAALRGIQRRTVQGIRYSLSRERGADGISSFGALSTALAAAVGTGNIVGVATAVALGGPGAVFWCWLTGVLGMATRYAETVLTLRHKEKLPGGGLTGGPMYVMERGMNSPGMAKCFSLMGVLAAVGTGALIQSNAIGAALPVSPVWTGAVAAVLTAMVIFGGARSIAGFCEKLVPAMAGIYLSGCVCLLWIHRGLLPETLRLIVISAFSARGAEGGYGTARGLFTNESGMGTAPMAAACAPGGDIHREALVAMTGVFWDTVVICAMTGLAVVSSVLAEPERFTGVDPARLCFLAFERLPAGEILLTGCLVTFAYATIVGWYWYGAVCGRYLWGEKGVRRYRLGYLLAVFAGGLTGLELVWSVGSILAGLMAAPNLMSLWKLRRVVVQEFRHSHTKCTQK